MKSAQDAFLGVDIGTSSIAAVVTDAKGRVVEELSVANPDAGEPTAKGVHEQDANAMLRAVESLVAKCEALARKRGLRIAETGWTGQMHGVVAVDRRLRALTPLVTWRDVRCAPPRLGAGVMADWRRRRVKGIWKALPITSFVLARRTGRCAMDATFRASLGREADLAPFARWLADTDDSPMLGDNQAGAYAARRLKPDAAVVNLGTSGQLSVVAEDDGASRITGPDAQRRPFPGGRTLVCRASHLGGAALARLREELGCSWGRLNAEAGRNPRIRRCVEAIVDDLVKGVDIRGVRTVVGIGTALRLNPCLKRAIERRFGVRCVIPEVREVAAWGAALYALDRRTARQAVVRNKRSAIVETLRHEILLGKYAVNERFPSEQMLVRRFKVARATVSGALAELKRDGVLRTKRGSGAYVTPRARGAGAIGLIVPGRGRGEIFEPVCRAIEREVGKLGYTTVSGGVLKGNAAARKAAALAFANRCVAEHVAGVIMEPVELLPGMDETTEEILSVLRGMDIPVVLIDRDIPSSAGRSDFDLVGIDNFRAGYNLGRTMVRAGARRICFLSFRGSAPTVRRRVCGVAQAVIEAGLRWGRGNVLELELGDAHALAKAMEGRNPPDALVCANDRTAAFAVRTLAAIGLSVPKDVRVSGFDDLVYAHKAKVPLTTVRQPCEELGRVALRTLVERILHRDLPPREILLGAELVLRDSTR